LLLVGSDVGSDQVEMSDGGNAMLLACPEMREN